MDITISERAPVEHYLSAFRRTLLYAYATEKPNGHTAALQEARLYLGALSRELDALIARQQKALHSATSTPSMRRKRAT